MKQGLGVLALLFAGAICAAEPAAAPADVKPEPSRAVASVPPAKPPEAAVAQTPRKPLDLRIGHIRNYMMPKEYLAAIAQPEPDRNTIVVEGSRVLVPMKQIENVPPGLASLWYAAKNPLNSWRLLAPVINAPDVPPDVVPPPVFRWGP